MCVCIYFDIPIQFQKMSELLVNPCIFTIKCARATFNLTRGVSLTIIYVVNASSCREIICDNWIFFTFLRRRAQAFHWRHSCRICDMVLSKEIYRISVMRLTDDTTGLEYFVLCVVYIIIYTYINQLDEQNTQMQSSVCVIMFRLHIYCLSLTLTQSARHEIKCSHMWW